VRRPAALLGLAALLIAQPAAAAPGCDLIRAMVGLDDKALTGIAVATRADGTFDLLYKGKPTMAKGASECDLDGPADDLEITCSWDAPDLDAAKAMLGQLRDRLDDCIATGMVRKDYETKVAGLKIPLLYEAAIDRRNDDTLDVELKIYQFLHDDQTASFEVDLSFSR